MLGFAFPPVMCLVAWVRGAATLKVGASASFSLVCSCGSAVSSFYSPDPHLDRRAVVFNAWVALTLGGRSASQVVEGYWYKTRMSWPVADASRA